MSLPEPKDIIEALRKVKQEEYNLMVEGNGRRPDEIVDMVAYAIRDFLPDAIKERLYKEVTNFYPEYTE